MSLHAQQIYIMLVFMHIKQTFHWLEYNAKNNFYSNYCHIYGSRIQILIHNYSKSHLIFTFGIQFFLNVRLKKRKLDIIEYYIR